MKALGRPTSRSDTQRGSDDVRRPTTTVRLAHFLNERPARRIGYGCCSKRSRWRHRTDVITRAAPPCRKLRVYASHCRRTIYKTRDRQAPVMKVTEQWPIFVYCRVTDGSAEVKATIVVVAMWTSMQADVSVWWLASCSCPVPRCCHC